MTRMVKYYMYFHQMRKLDCKISIQLHVVQQPIIKAYPTFFLMEQTEMANQEPVQSP